MSKFSRMMSILIHLQTRSLIKAQELSDILETDLKTVYRDIESLRTAHIPIESKSGRYGGYFLPRDFYFKTPKLTADEVAALFLAGEILTKKNGFIFEKDFRSLLSKMAKGLSKKEIEASSGKIASISYEIEALKTKIMETNFYIIEKAILDKKSLEVKYYTFSRNEIRQRVLDPYHLIYKSGAWYLIAYCHWRKDIKIFRVDRMDNVKPLNRKFKVREDFSLNEYLKNSWQITRGEEIEVKIRFFSPASKFVQEMEWLPTQKIQQEDNENIIFCAKVSGLLEIKQWVLGFGKYAEVIEPKTLRNEIIAEVQETLSCYTDRG